MNTPLPPLDSTAWDASDRIYVAFSGGADSVCLVKRLLDAGLGDRIEAIHVDHRLDPDSRARAERAVKIARRHHVAIEVIVLDPARFETHCGPEAAARHARYAALGERLAPGDSLLTAHHLDDQIETLLLQLLRGGGPRGLSGMPVRRRLGAGWLGRPLLNWPRAALQEELRQAELDWIEDPTNASTDPDRNFLRHEILPLIENRWGPGYRRSILRAQRLQAHAAGLVAEQAQRDFDRLRGDGRADQNTTTLTLDAWLALPSSDAYEALRVWLDPVPVPPYERLQEFRRQCRVAAPDRAPMIATDRLALHAWRGRLWKDAWPEPVPRSWSQPVDTAGGAVRLPYGLGRLDARRWPSGAIAVGALRAGDRMRIAPRRPAQRTGELLRTAGVPPWRRHRLPCLRIENRLVAIGDRWVDPDQDRLSLQWRDVPLELLPYAGRNDAV